LATLKYDDESASFIRIEREPARIRRKLGYWDWIKIISVSILVIAAISCLLGVHYNLYEGEHAALKSYGNEIAPSTDEAGLDLATFSVDQLKAEDGLQQLLNASRLSARFRRLESGWEIIFFEEKWLSTAPKVVLIGKKGEARPYWMEIRAPLRSPRKIQLIQVGEKYYTIELTLGKHSFNLSEWQAETLIKTIQKVCD